MFYDISKEEVSLKAEYAARFPIELENVENETRSLETEIDKLKKALESRSLEVKDEINLRIKNLEEEINELEKIKFSLFIILKSIS